MINHTLWVEQYRPKTLEQCILSERLREVFTTIRTSGEMQNMLFVGPAGTGKTSVAKALASDMGMDVLVVNGSENSGIDTLRVEIRNFASTVSFSDGGKVVIIDEAEYLNPNSTQPAFRAFVEEFSATCQFILCANYPSRLIPEIRSRFPSIDFTPTNEEKPLLAKEYAKRVVSILTENGVSVDKDTVRAVVVRHFPDLRAILGNLQLHAVDGTIKASVLSAVTPTTELVKILREKDFDRLRVWVSNNTGGEVATVFRTLYDGLLSKVDEPANFVRITNTYQYQSAFVMDQEVNFLAYLVEVMLECGVS
jgi:DNA polymerase III delta prime subunit